MPTEEVPKEAFSPSITTISDKKLVILDNSNIVESYPGVSLPLTISFVHFVYSNVFKNEAFRLSKNKKLVELNMAHNIICSRQVRFILINRGTIHYNISLIAFFKP